MYTKLHTQTVGYLNTCTHTRCIIFDKCKARIEFVVDTKLNIKKKDRDENSTSLLIPSSLSLSPLAE